MNVSLKFLNPYYYKQGFSSVEICDVPRKNLSPWAVQKWFLEVKHVASGIVFYSLNPNYTVKLYKLKQFS